MKELGAAGVGGGRALGFPRCRGHPAGVQLLVRGQMPEPCKCRGEVVTDPRSWLASRCCTGPVSTNVSGTGEPGPWPCFFRDEIFCLFPILKGQ